MGRIERDFNRAAGRYPGRIALSHNGGDVTYADLMGSSLALADEIKRMLPGGGRPVGVLLPNSVEFVRAVLAVWYSGNAVVPVSVAYPDEAVMRIADLVKTNLFICDRRGIRRLKGFRGACIPAKPEKNHRRRAPGGLDAEDPLGFTPEHAVVFLTSGTTGQPKIVGLTHDNIRCNLASARKSIPRQARARTYMCLPMCHSYGFTLQMLAALMSGGTLHIGGTYRLGTDFAGDLASSQCTSIFGVPATFRMLVDGIRRRGLESAAAKIKCVVNGASAMTQDLLDALRATFTNARICLTYGLSEASPLVTALPPELLDRKGCSIGRAVDGVDLTLLLAGGRVGAEAGSVGEILIRGGSVIERYMGSPRADAESFHDGYLKTGDIGAIDGDGCVYFRGRSKDLINRGGEKVYPCDVEKVLLRRSEIAEAAVVACPHPVLGEVPFAFVRPAEGSEVDWAKIRKWCAAHLAQHEVPVGFKAVESLPKTHTGKIRKTELAAMLASGGTGDDAGSA